jgi:hypothetical protein
MSQPESTFAVWLTQGQGLSLQQLAPGFSLKFYGADLEQGSIDVTDIVKMDMCVIASYVHSDFPLNLKRSLLSSDINGSTVDPSLQVLIRWSRTPLELSTWEDEDALRQRFP